MPRSSSHLQAILSAVGSNRPRLSAYAAERLRRETGDNRYYAPIERRNVTISQRVSDILAKPFKVLFSEPMLIVITIYQSVRPIPIDYFCCALTDPLLQFIFG